MSLKVERRIVKWGHAYGIRLSKDEVEAKLRTKAGRKVRAIVEPQQDAPNDLRSLIGFGSKRRYDTRRILEEEFGRS